ncbi:FHA domain-containing protein [Streptosporangium sp. NPDC048047]|uniref:FHA domain-containing protein n=1 Tax=Streptosporangium sp. NPDC048047 TaxID=3155748 RepID=UPI003412C16B
MRGVIVQLPAPRGADVPELHELAVGQDATFGRGADGYPVDIRLPNPGVSRLAGRVRAVEDHWTISNLSATATYVVENPEGGGEFVKVAPRRLDMPVPFEFARVVVPGTQGSASFMVFASQHAYADPGIPEPGHGEATTAAFSLDETTKYFLILVALCEPRLRDSSTVVIPTVPEILERLHGLPQCPDLTRSAVNFHIDYLARTKLRVKEPSEGGAPAKADWQRAALVSLALRFDLVREEHLALLP